MHLWWKIFQVLELDKKARLDLVLLAQSGGVGRTYANKIMWDLLSNWALEYTYRDLSNKVSSEVKWVRMEFDRPPAGHKDLRWWRWEFLQVVPKHMAPWSSKAHLKESWELQLGPGGEPLPPPLCWGGAWQ